MPPVPPSSPRPRPTVLLVVLAVGIVVLVAAVYGIVRQPADDGDATTQSTTPSPDRATPSAAATLEPASTADSEASVPGALPAMADPTDYASVVAERLLTWDTTTGLEPADYAAPVVDGASHPDNEALRGDVANYLPTEQAWAHLSDYETRQYVTIDRAFVPETWDEAKAAAAAGRIPDGAIAVTLATTVHRSGVWNGEAVSADHDLAFTIFLGCRPVFDHCRILRLSAINTPLR